MTDPSPDISAAVPVVVIPAYQPGATLVDMVNELLADPSQAVIVVDDGSAKECREVFTALGANPRVHVLRHAVNLGKGQALKTAFNYFLLQFSDKHVGVVTADADGQHLVSDIRHVARVFAEDPTSLVLGRRRMDREVPWKSAVGNRLTRYVFHGLLGRKIEDTQTGLRGISRAFLPELLRIPASRYEFELEMLIRAVSRDLRVREVNIQTVYQDANRGSHFNPLLDSLRIYFVFLRFVALSLITAALDFSVFVAAYHLSANILLSTVAARSVAGLFNFYFARRVVFRSHGSVGRQVLAYVGLVLWLMSVSYALLTALVIFLRFNIYASKIIAETTLFLASFATQRLLIFTRRQPKAANRASTDWDAYYTRSPRQAQITRRITARVLMKLMRRHAPPSAASICELGGANSCFYLPVRSAFGNVEYTIIDNNALGLDLVRTRARRDSALRTRNENVLVLTDGLVCADIVFSVGLIEHFSPPETAVAIRKHFSCARSGAVVIITFPTPTWLYRTTRALAEWCGLWEFPDERPLAFDEVEAEIRKYGTILDSRINWPIVLTQGIVVARAA